MTHDYKSVLEYLDKAEISLERDQPSHEIINIIRFAIKLAEKKLIMTLKTFDVLILRVHY
jgi:hypothetical protein